MARKVINVVYKVDDKELLKAKTSIQGVEKETKDAEKEMLDLDKAIKKTGRDGAKEMNSFGRAIDTISFAAITAGAFALGKTIFDLGVKQQQLNIAFETFLGSASKAKKVIADLTKFSIVTPFTPDQVNGAAKALLAFGVEGEDIIPTLKMLGDVSAGTGKDLAEMAVIFGQIRSTGRLMGQDLLQLINAGFNPLQVISEKTGKSVKVLKEEMEKGLISFEMVSDAFKTATSEGGKFFNLMEAQSQSIGGKLSTITGNIQEVAKGIFESNIDLITLFVDKLGKATDAILDYVKTANSDPIFEKATENAESYRLALDAAFKEFEAGKGPEALNKALAENVKATNDWKESAKELKDQLADKDQVIKGGLLPDYSRLVTVQKAEAKTVELLSKLTQEYLKKINAYVPAVQEMTKEEKKLLEERQKLIAAMLADQSENPIDFAGLVMPDEENYNELTKAVDKVYDIVKTGNEQIHQENVNAGISELEERKRIINEREKLEEQAAEQIKQLQIQLARELLSNLLMENTISTDSINEKYDREIEAAGDNEDAKKEIRKREQIELKRIEEENIKIQKENAIRGIGISTAEAIVKTFVKYGFTIAGIKAAALMAAIGVVQAANVRKYKDGGINIDGPGSSTSDSIPAFLSKGESVINASATSRSQNLLEAINDRRIDDSILYKLSSNGGRQAGFDDSGIIDAINKNKVDYIKQGYSLHEVMMLGKSFKRTIRSQVQGY